MGISTAPGAAGIAIVRISGTESLAIADQIIRCNRRISSLAGNNMAHGFVADGNDIDEVVVLVFKAPHSYTREDVVEIQGHGGSICARRILSAVLRHGARMAEPGEFTKRAFLNGRIDLVQAEAVIDLINAQSERAASSAIEQLEGKLSDYIRTCYDKMLTAAADLEYSLDFEEGDLGDDYFRKIAELVENVNVTLEEILNTWEEGVLLREGLKIVISGPPNAGKSTLLNGLLGRNRSIVSETPGTTRDTIEEQSVLEGIPVRYVDTAGLRDASCTVEQDGVRRAKESIATAGINIRVIDGSAPLEASQKPEEWPNADHWLIVLNKADLGLVMRKSDFPVNLRCVECCLHDETGIKTVRDALKVMINISTGSTMPHATISERHRAMIQYAQNELNECMILLKQRGEESAAEAAAALRRATEKVGEITGHFYTDDLLTKVFSRFCVGK